MGMTHEQTWGATHEHAWGMTRERVDRRCMWPHGHASCNVHGCTARMARLHACRKSLPPTICGRPVRRRPDMWPDVTGPRHARSVRRAGRAAAAALAARRGSSATAKTRGALSCTASALRLGGSTRARGKAPSRPFSNATPTRSGQRSRCGEAAVMRQPLCVHVVGGGRACRHAWLLHNSACRAAMQQGRLKAAAGRSAVRCTPARIPPPVDATCAVNVCAACAGERRGVECTRDRRGRAPPHKGLQLQEEHMSEKVLRVLPGGRRGPLTKGGLLLHAGCTPARRTPSQRRGVGGRAVASRMYTRAAHCISKGRREGGLLLAGRRPAWRALPTKGGGCCKQNALCTAPLTKVWIHAFSAPGLCGAGVHWMHCCCKQQCTHCFLHIKKCAWLSRLAARWRGGATSCTHARSGLDGVAFGEGWPLRWRGVGLSLGWREGKSVGRTGLWAGEVEAVPGLEVKSGLWGKPVCALVRGVCPWAGGREWPSGRAGLCAGEGGLSMGWREGVAFRESWSVRW
eukprot:363145-Chlamydomonas_euryale.AAC.15